jgi:hypothetical protein
MQACNHIQKSVPFLIPFMCQSILYNCNTNFFRDPQFVAFAVSGLEISFVVSFILWQHASYELKSDSFHPGAERVVRTGLVMRWTDDQSSGEKFCLGIYTPGLVKAVVGRMVVLNGPNLD